MKTLNQVHEQLQKVFDNLSDGSLDVKVAGELHNNVGKQIGLVKLRLDYDALRGLSSPIEFLEDIKK